ncbi:MAG: LemA family protein [Candidatus Nanopusillus sp.]
MGSWLIIVIILVVFLVLAIGFYIAVYNSLIALKKNAEKAWSNIDVLLQKRHDMLIKLVETVSSYLRYEKSVFERVTQLRSQFMSIPPDDIQGKINLSNMITGMFRYLFAVIENYPDLKANQNVMHLQQIIVELESQLADARQFYNEAVTMLNTKIEQIPYNFIASMAGIKPMPLYRAPEEVKQDVSTRLEF